MLRCGRLLCRLLSQETAKNGLPPERVFSIPEATLIRITFAPASEHAVLSSSAGLFLIDLSAADDSAAGEALNP